MRKPADIYIRQKIGLFNCGGLKMTFGEMYSGDSGLDFLSSPNKPNTARQLCFNI